MHDMMNDFRFIFPTKLDKYKNSERKFAGMNALASDYCMRDVYNGAECDLFPLLNDSYDGLHKGEVILTSLGDDILLQLIQNQVKRKMTHFQDMEDYYHKVARKHKKFETLTFSMRIKNYDYSHEPLNYIPQESLNLVTRHFFNIIRSRSVFKEYVVGHQWIYLMDTNSNPYIHVTLYLNDEKFNDHITNDINDVWYNALKKHEQFGEIFYLTMTNNFKSQWYYYKDSNVKGMTNRDFYKKDGVVIIRSDFNGTDYGLKAASNNLNKKTFISYLYKLSKKSYIPQSGRAIGFSSIK